MGHDKQSHSYGKTREHLHNNKSQVKGLPSHGHVPCGQIGKLGYMVRQCILVLTENKRAELSRHSIRCLGSYRSHEEQEFGHISADHLHLTEQQEG